MLYFRLILLSCATWCTFLPGKCQYNPDISKTKQRFLKFDSAHFSDNFKLRFNRIEILVFRFDTTALRQGNTFDLYANMRNENYNHHLNTPSNILTMSKAAFDLGSPSFISAYPLQVDMET